MQDKEEAQRLPMRDHIADRSILLFARQGVAGTTEEQICEAAQVTPEQFGRCYSSREAVLERILERYIANTEAHTPSREEIDRMAEEAEPREVLWSLFYVFAPEEREKYHQVIQIIMHEQYRNEQVGAFVQDYLMKSVEDYIAYTITRLAQSGRIPPLDARLYAKMINSINLITTLEFAHSTVEEFARPGRVRRQEALTMLINRIVDGQ